MKRLKYLLMIILIATITGAVFFACGAKFPEDDEELIRAGKNYRITFSGNGGNFDGSPEVYMYYKTDGIKAPDPSTSAVSGLIPSRREQSVVGWFYKEVSQTNENGVPVESFIEIDWDFSKDKVTQDMMDEQPNYRKTGKTLYNFTLYAKWEYDLYIDYSVSYVQLDKETYEGTLTAGGASKDAEQDQHTIVQTEKRTPTQMMSYLGTTVTHSSGTAVPEDFDPIKHADIKRSNEILPTYYLDAELTTPVSFPLSSGIAPKPIQGENHLRLYVKFFNQRFTVLSAPGDLSSFVDTNYYLWRDIDFSPKLTSSKPSEADQRKSITAGALFKNKIFIGNGYTISNIAINALQADGDDAMYGMFGKIINSEITDVTFENCAVYYNLNNDTVNNIKCGLLAAEISGNDTVISNVNFIDTIGYIRSNYSNKSYSVSYGATNDYIYATKSDNGTVSASIEGKTAIKFANIYAELVDAAETGNLSDATKCGFNVWSQHDVSYEDLNLEIGAFNQKPTKRDAKEYVLDGTSSEYYFTLDITLTEIDGVGLTIFGKRFDDASNSILNFTETAAGYVLRLYVPESVKGGRIIADWSDELSDEYKVRVFGGGAALDTAYNIKLPSTEKVTVDYNPFEEEIVYTSATEIKDYVPSEAGTTLQDRPSGYAIPLRLKIFASIGDSNSATSITKYEDITVTINGIEHHVKDLKLTSQTTGGDRSHYVEFWQIIDPSDVEGTRAVIIKFYGTVDGDLSGKPRYEIRLEVNPGEGVKFEGEPDLEPEPTIFNGVEMPIVPQFQGTNDLPLMMPPLKKAFLG